MPFRTLYCPLCGSNWKVVAAPVETRVPMTCVPCEERLPQQVHDSDDITDEELNQGEDRRDS